MVALGLIMPLLAAGGWLWWIYHSDRFEKEPWDLVLKTLGIAAGAGVVGLIVQVIIVYAILGGGGSAAGAVVGALFLLPFHLAGIAGAMYYLPFRNANWNEPFDGLVYGGAAGIGYGLTYTIIALFQTPLLGFRLAIFSIPVYMLAGLVIGHYMSRVKFGQPHEAKSQWVRGLGIAGVFLFGIEMAQVAGGRVVAGSAMASMFAYASNTLAWILATKAMEEKNWQSQFNMAKYRLQLAPTGCAHCGAGHPVQAAYCNHCGNPLEHQRGA